MSVNRKTRIKKKRDKQYSDYCKKHDAGSSSKEETLKYCLLNKCLLHLIGIFRVVRAVQRK